MCDDLLDNILKLPRDTTDWHEVIAKLEESSGDDGGYTRDLIARIYRDCLGDEENYLQKKTANLETGYD